MNNQFMQILFRLLIVISSILAIISFIYIAFKTAYPFIFGLIIAFFLNPFVNFLQEKFRMNRWISVTIVLLFVNSIIIGFITVFVSEIIIGTNYLSRSVPFHLHSSIDHVKDTVTLKIIPIYEQISAMFHSLDSDHQMTILAYIETITSHITSNVSNIVQSLLNGVSEFLLALPNLASVIIFSLLATFFISKDWYRLVFLFRKWTPNIVALRTKEVMKSLKKAFVGFILAQLILISITCGIVLVGLLILRIEYPITVAIIIAIVDLLPYLGTGLIFIPWIFYMFFSNQLSLTIGLCILYAVIIIQRQIMEPKILSANIGVDPLATLLSLFVGYKLFGFLGLMIGPVILVLLQTLIDAHVFKDLRDYITKG